jgi:predicted amidophosphoribosyltransferase
MLLMVVLSVIRHSYANPGEDSYLVPVPEELKRLWIRGWSQMAGPAAGMRAASKKSCRLVLAEREKR